jgi:hypothetical protein
LSRSRVVSTVVLAVLSASAADAAARLEVKGSVQPQDEELVVSLEVDNRGDAAVAPLVIQGELLGRYDEVQKDTGVAAGSWTEAELRFPRHVADRPGVHVVALRLDYQSSASSPWSSQAAYLLLALGANPPPAVKVFVGDTTIETRGRVEVALESADGRPHVARVRLLTPKGLNPFGETGEVAVPAQGRAVAGLEVLRGSAERNMRHGILVAASTTDGDVQTSAVAEGAVVIEKDPAVMPRLRLPLTLLSIGLLFTATAVEILRRWPRAGAG